MGALGVNGRRNDGPADDNLAGELRVLAFTVIVVWFALWGFYDHVLAPSWKLIAAHLPGGN